jgi:hypothetical protein
MITETPNEVESFKNLLIKKTWVIIGQIYMKAVWYNVNSSFFFKSWSPGGATIGTNIFAYVYIESKIFSRTSRPILIKPSTKHSKVKKILNHRNNRPGPLQRGDNHKNGVGLFLKKKSSQVKSQWAIIGLMYMKAFWYGVDSKLWTSWLPGVGRGHNREDHILHMFILKKKSYPDPAGLFQLNLVQIILG